MHTGKPTGVAVSHCMTWFRTRRYFHVTALRNALRNPPKQLQLLSNRRRLPSNRCCLAQQKKQKRGDTGAPCSRTPPLLLRHLLSLFGKAPPRGRLHLKERSGQRAVERGCARCHPHWSRRARQLITHLCSVSTDCGFIYLLVANTRLQMDILLDAPLPFGGWGRRHPRSGKSPPPP